MVNPTVVFVGPRQVEVQDRPIPKPGPGQLLIQTHVSLISTGTELSVLDGNSPAGEIWSRFRQYPYMPGYDSVGTVLEVGDGVDSSWIGKCAASSGIHAAYVTVDKSHCWQVTREISDEEASFLSLAHVALNGVRRSRLVFGEAAVVYGLGIIGHITAQLCHFAGARPVIGVDVSNRRVSLLAEKHGILGVVASDSDVKEAVHAATSGRMADVVFELTGNPNVIPEEFRVLHPLGRCVIVSSPRAPTLFDFHDLCNGPSYTIIGAHNYSHPAHATPENPWTWDRHAEMFFSLVADGDLDVSRLVSHREPYDGAPELYEMLLADRSEAMGVVLVWPQS